MSKNKIFCNKPKEAEIFHYLVNYLEIDKPKRITDIYFRYGVSKQVAEEMFYDGCIEVGKRYCKGTFIIKYVLVIHSSQEAIVTSGKVVTPSGYHIDAKQLIQVRSWVWKNVDYQIMDFFKKANRLNEVSFDKFENSPIQSEQSDPEYIYIEKDAVDIEAIGDQETEEYAGILSSVILSLSSDRERDIINLAFYGDMTNAEIAEHLDITPTNVSSTKSRALMHIKARLAAFPELQSLFN